MGREDAGKPAPIMGTDEAAELLGVSAPTVREMCRDGVLPATKLTPNGDWRIRRGELLLMLGLME